MSRFNPRSREGATCCRRCRNQPLRQKRSLKILFAPRSRRRYFNVGKIGRNTPSTPLVPRRFQAQEEHFLRFPCSRRIRRESSENRQNTVSLGRIGLIDDSTESYPSPANVLRIASKIIFAPNVGTAIPICLRFSSFEPENLKVGGNV